MTISPVRTVDKTLVLATLGVAILALISLTIGVYNVSLRGVIAGSDNLNESLVFMTSRVPRTIAIVLVGISTSVCGLIMQMLARNKFVSPSTSGTVESASLGILAVAIFYPAATMFAKMAVGTVFALAGTVLFLAILRTIPMRSPLVVPLVGIMFGGVIGAVATFFAYRYDLLQSLAAWTGGDFSRILKGRYELLWLSGALTVIAYIAANKFTVIGMGDSFATNLGLDYRHVMAMGLGIVATVTAVNVVTVGAIPFLGLIVPNVVSIMIGDNVRRAVPYVAVCGAGFLLLCDIAGRVLRYPFEIPIGTVAGVMGSVLFVFLLLRGSKRGR